MKKIISIITLALLVFALSGCDLIGSDTIDQVTDELCSENPDSELCNIDSLDDIEESVVLALFNNMLDNYDVMDINEYCDQFISTENVQLLEICKTDITKLFPEGIENFEVLSVVKDGEEYKIELHNILNDDMIMFSLGINMENDQIVVTKMQYGPIYVLSPPDEDELIKLIESFIMDMENDALTDKQVCEIWDGVDDDCDGIEDARRKFKAGADLSKKVNILDPDDDGDGILVGEISFTIDGHVTVLKIAFEIDKSASELKLMIRGIEDDSMLFHSEDILLQLEEFIMDYTDVNIPTLEFYTKWFDQTKYEKCGIENADGSLSTCPADTPVRSSRRVENDPIKYKFLVDTRKNVSGDTGTPVYEAVFEADFNGHVTVLKVSYTEEETDGKMNVIEYHSENIIKMEVIEQLEKFALDFVDPTITDETFCLNWFGQADGVGETCCPTCRPSTKSSDEAENDPIKHRFVIKTITAPIDNTETPFYEAVFEAELDGHVTVLKIAFDVNNTGSGSRIMVLDIDYDEVFELEEIEDFWNSFIEDYLDSTITTEEINTIYFNGMVGSGFMDERSSDLENGTVIQTISVNYSQNTPDSFFDVELEIVYGDEIYSSTIKIKVNRIDMALYMTFVDQYAIAEVTYEDAIATLEAYKKGYDHYVALSNSRCEISVVDFQQEECIVEREMMINDGYKLVDFELQMMESTYIVVFTFEDPDFNQITKTKMVFFYEYGDSYLLAFFDTYVGIDNAEIDLLLENFVKDAGDTSVLTTSVCHFVSGGSDGEDNDCDGVVTNVRDNGYTLAIGEKDDLGDNYIIEFIFRNATSTYSEFYYFTFYYDEDMVLQASMNLLDTKAFIYTDIYTFFEEVNDFTIPVDKVCTINVHEESYELCETVRNFHESNEYILLITEISADEEMNVTVLAVTYDIDGNEIEQNYYVFYYQASTYGVNPYFIESGLNGEMPAEN